MTRDRYTVDHSWKTSFDGKKVQIPQFREHLSENDGYKYMNSGPNRRVDKIEIFPTACLEGLESLIKSESDLELETKKKLKKMITDKTIKYD